MKTEAELHAMLPPAKKHREPPARGWTGWGRPSPEAQRARGPADTLIQTYDP